MHVMLHQKHKYTCRAIVASFAFLAAYDLIVHDSHSIITDTIFNPFTAIILFQVQSCQIHQSSISFSDESNI
jgi:hypothetical protein